MASSISGGLDVDSIVSQLMYVERAPARSLERERQELRARMSALDRFEGSLETLRSAADGVRKGNSLEARTATSSNDSAVTVTAAAGTQTGAYRVGVTQLAASHNIASTTFGSLTDTLTSGTFDLTIGGGETFSISVGSGSNTLEGLRDAIQASGANVSTSVLFDGAAYRLSMLSGQSGLAGTITIDNFSNGTLQSELGFGQTSAAADALFSINGVSLSRSSNSVSDVINGLTFDLKEAGLPDAMVSVAADPAQGVELIKDFVDAYNTLFNQAKADLRRPDNTPGLLSQMSSVKRILDNLRSTMSRSVPGLDGDAQTLRQAGIEFQNDGSISVDEAKLKDAIASGDAADLFGISGRSVDPQIEFAGAGRTTQGGDYEVYVTQAAEQARVVGTNDLSGGLAGNETLTFSDGTDSVDVQLASGQTTSQVVDAINIGLAGSNMNLIASDDGTGRIKLTSMSFGSGASIDVTSDMDGAGFTGFGTAGATDSGLDVEGTIGGEAATGTGRLLKSTAGDSEGLQVSVRATASDIPQGGTSFGATTVSIGVGEALHRSLDSTLSSTSGAVAHERTGLNSRDKVLEERISSIDRRLDKRQIRFTREFARADIALQQMSALTQQVQAQIAQFGGS